MTIHTDKDDARETLLRFYDALDQNQFDAASRHFAFDGEWSRKGEVLTGPEQVSAVFAGRDPEHCVRHVISNLIVSPCIDGMEFSLYITAWVGQSKDGEIPVVGGPTMVLDSRGLLVRHGGVWKIKRKDTNRRFMVGPQTT